MKIAPSLLSIRDITALKTTRMGLGGDCEQTVTDDMLRACLEIPRLPRT